MYKITRRSAIGVVSLVAAAAVAVPGPRLWGRLVSKIATKKSGTPIRRENALSGSTEWRLGANGANAADNAHLQIKGYASATSVNVGASVDFHVTTNPADDFTVAIYRIGYYGGAGARHIVTSPTLKGVVQADPKLDPTTGEISCDWSPSWRLDIPAGWTSGYYLAVFTTTGGYRSYTPFVVRDDQRKADLCVVIPFATYQAYNQWPRDGRLGKSLYYGYPDSARSAAPGSSTPNVYDDRAFHVSFDRPYDGYGMPNLADLDQTFVQWAEERGYDMTYASSMDLHDGRVDPSKYAGVIFCGHDEYWSREMRDRVELAVDRGTSIAFLAANNVYWHVRVLPSAGASESRTVVCYKTSPDPEAVPGGATGQWRDSSPGPNDPEQRLVGVLYNGIVATPTPLVVQAADHWFWAGTGLRDGDTIDKVIAGEADGFLPNLPGPKDAKQTLLSASPYRRNTPDGPELTQNTSVYTNAAGALVFGAGSLYWSYALGKKDYVDERIKRATANLVDHIVERR